MDSQVNTSVANDVDFLEFRFGETIRQKCLSSRKFHRFFGRLLAQTFGTFVARFRDFIAQNCPLVGRSMNEGALKVTRPSFFEGVPSYFEALWYPHLYFYRKSNT